MRTQLVIDYFGTAAETARQLGISKGAISQWGEHVPFARALQIERMTRGRLKFSPRHYPQAKAAVGGGR